MEFIIAIFVVLFLIFIYKRFTKPRNQYYVSGSIKNSDGFPGGFKATHIDAESKEEAKQKFLQQIKTTDPLTKVEVSVQIDQDGKLMEETSQTFDYMIKTGELNNVADNLLKALEYATIYTTSQQNSALLKKAKKLVKEITTSKFAKISEARHELKGIFIPKSEFADPKTDVSLMEVYVKGKGAPLQTFIDKVVKAIEELEGYPPK